MLKQIMQLIENSAAPVNTRMISKQLGVDESAVAGMLDHLVNKGFLREESQAQASTCNIAGSCAGCASRQGCAFSGNLPRMYRLANRSPQSQ